MSNGQNDELGIDLEFNDSDANRKADAFFAKMEAIQKGINTFGKDSTFGKDLSKQLVDLERRATQTRRTFQDMVTIPVKGGALDGLSQSAVRLQKEAIIVQKRLADIRAVDQRGKSDSFLKILSEDAETAGLQLARLERQIERVNRRRSASSPASLPAGGSGVGEGLASGFGIPTSAAAGSAAIAAGIAVVGKASLDAATEAKNAQVLLQSTAKETGKEYDKLKAQALAFGDATALSNSKAEATFARLTNFANAAGRSDKLEEFRKRFADLAAAKGINAENLGLIATQLNNLTDEATDKILNANPSAFYDKFALSLHKTADALTDSEKRAAVFDEILKRGALFDGTAEHRVNSAAGAMDQFNRTFENAKTSIGGALIPLVEFTNAAIKLITADPAKFTSQAVLDEVARNQQAAQAKRVDQAVADLREMDKKIADAQKAPLASLQNFALSRLNITTAFNDPVARQKAIDDAIKEAQTFVGDLQKRLEKALSRGDLAVIKFANAEFRRNINLFDADTRDQFIQNFSSAYSEGFRKILADAKKTLPEIRKALKEITASPDLTGGDRERLIKDFQAVIAKSVADGKAKIAELGKATDALFAGLFATAGQNNPFVKVFTDADKAIENVRISTAALNKDLQAVALNLVRQQNSADLFNARLNAGLESFDLREQAAAFRTGRITPKDNGRVDQATMDRIIKAAIQNREQVAGGGTFARDIGLDFNKLTEDQRRDLFEQQSIRNLRGAGQNDRMIASFLARQRADIESGAVVDPNASIQQRLDKQLQIIENLRPGSDTERQIADRRIISLTNSLRPDQLTDRQNAAAAQARENEAARIENAERKAAEERAYQSTVQKSIDTNIAKLVKIAETEGMAGTIRIINEADDRVKVSLGKRPTDRSTAEMMEP